MATVKIGGYDYVVYLGDGTVFESSRYGDVRHDLLRIRLDKDCHEKVKLTTLLHEAIHAMSFTAGIKMTEDQIDPLAHQMHAFLIENGVDLTPLHKTIGEAVMQQA